MKIEVAFPNRFISVQDVAFFEIICDRDSVMLYVIFSAAEAETLRAQTLYTMASWKKLNGSQEGFEGASRRVMQIAIEQLRNEKILSIHKIFNDLQTFKDHPPRKLTGQIGQ